MFSALLAAYSGRDVDFVYVQGFPETSNAVAHSFRTRLGHRPQYKMVAGEVPFHLPGAAEVYKVIISQCFQPMLTLQISNLGMKSLKLCLSCGVLLIVRWS